LCETKQFTAGPLRRVLIVEDDLDISTTLKTFLEIQGYEAHVAENGLVALDFARQSKALDLILLDIKMPIMDGRQFGIEFRQFDHKTPIVVMTAFSDSPEAATDIGAKAWLRKPFDLDELLKNIKKFGGDE